MEYEYNIRSMIALITPLAKERGERGYGCFQCSVGLTVNGYRWAMFYFRSGHNFLTILLKNTEARLSQAKEASDFRSVVMTGYSWISRAKFRGKSPRVLGGVLCFCVFLLASLPYCPTSLV